MLLLLDRERETETQRESERDRETDRVIYKLRLNSWKTKYSQNVTCVCKNILSVKHILLECPITTKLFQKNGYDFIAGNNVRDILYNTIVINSVVKLIVHSPVVPTA